MSGADKTEKPTPKRLREARREGRIARSADLAAWASMLAATFLLELSLRLGAARARELVAAATRAAAAPEPGRALGVLGDGLRTAAIASAPLAVGMVVVGVATNLAQTGFVPSSALLRPKFERVNPVAGAKRLFSAASAWEAAKTVLKLAILAWVAARSVTAVAPRLADGGGLSSAAVVGVVAHESLRLARNVAAAGLVLALVDYGFQRRRISKALAMTKQEVKEEHRQSEGDPHLKGAIRSRQLAMSRNRMMAEVARADVVVVNPTHVAVALRYEPSRGAPRVVAKGAGAVAARIREEAERTGVPMVQDVPLARTLHRLCDLGDEIPPELYDAVARLLAFIFSLKRDAPAAGVYRLPAPLLPA